MKMIKKIAVLTTVLVTLFLRMDAQQSGDIKGIWVNEKKDVRVEIYQSGDKYFGKISWSADMYAADGKTPNKDLKNPDDKLKQRNLAGINILTGFSFAGSEWTGGEIYDPRSGKTYKGNMKIKGNSLEIRGYVGSPVFGKTTSWTRVS